MAAFLAQMEERSQAFHIGNAPLISGEIITPRTLPSLNIMVAKGILALIIMCLGVLCMMEYPEFGIPTIIAITIYMTYQIVFRFARTGGEPFSKEDSDDCR